MAGPPDWVQDHAGQIIGSSHITIEHPARRLETLTKWGPVGQPGVAYGIRIGFLGGLPWDNQRRSAVFSNSFWEIKSQHPPTTVFFPMSQARSATRVGPRILTLLICSISQKDNTVRNDGLAVKHK